ncbi:hypothetical protein FACS1894105_09260 [Clostridia bacterium]|nr:hypothetical protein FACS1894105_09260 [Clostridia bacterium]
MNEIERFYVEIENSGTVIINKRFRHADTIAASVCNDDGDCLIAVDETLSETTAELKSALLHEQGHCETYAFYTPLSIAVMRGKCEYQADRYVAENHITPRRVHDAHIKFGCETIGDFAEYFNVTPAYMQRIFDILERIPDYLK